MLVASRANSPHLEMLYQARFSKQRCHIKAIQHGEQSADPVDTVVLTFRNVGLLLVDRSFPTRSPKNTLLQSVVSSLQRFRDDIDPVLHIYV